MGSDIILCMALIASFAFVIQFLLSILGSDLDTDIDIVKPRLKEWKKSERIRLKLTRKQL